jgi:hypothetical protein
MAIWPVVSNNWIVKKPVLKPLLISPQQFLGSRVLCPRPSKNLQEWLTPPLALAIANSTACSFKAGVSDMANSVFSFRYATLKAMPKFSARN